METTDNFEVQAVRSWLVRQRTDEIVDTAILYGKTREDMTQLAIELSLCPIHFIDWAICFDDNTAGCEQVRTIFPDIHDT